MGIEPTSSAWKAEVLPLNYTRHDRSFESAESLPVLLNRKARHAHKGKPMVEGEGFEPPKAKPADLQSAPVDRLGTPPGRKPAIVLMVRRRVNTRNALNLRGLRTAPGHPASDQKTLHYQPLARSA